jgi:DNA/RNA-binding domain of Phe-tRNA-synthetase-like protein
MGGEDPLIQAGAVAPELAAELPGFGLAWCAVAVRDPFGPGFPERIRRLSDRHRGAQAIALRTRSIPHAYRVLYRHLGIEPDVVRIACEAYMVERLRRGGYPSRNRLSDALLIACVETEVGVYALDADRVVGEPRLLLASGRVEVADETGRLAAPFEPVESVTAGTRRLLLYAFLADGVPDIAIEEALWTAADLLSG